MKIGLTEDSTQRLRDRWRMTASVCFGCVFLLGMAANGSAIVIDFESGYSDLDPLGVMSVPGNMVVFGVGPASGSTGPAYIAEVGGATTGFVPGDSPAGGVGGNYFLTDEDAGPLDVKHDYFMGFASPVDGLSLDLYDYRADGFAVVGDSVTLYVYADITGTTLLGSDTYTIDGTEVDGHVETLSIPSLSGDIKLAHVAFMSDRGDVGTGIDNIRFRNAAPRSVPEAGMTFTFMSITLLAMAGLKSRMVRA